MSLDKYKMPRLSDKHRAEKHEKNEDRKMEKKEDKKKK